MEELTLPATLESLALVRAYVDEAAERAGLESRARYRLRLAVDEIATNVVTHGYEEAGLTGNLRLETTVGDDRLTIVLEDTGREFDPAQRELPTDLHLPLEQRTVGGLGIYLTLSGVDEFNYERQGGCNRSLFSMRLTPEPQT